MSEHDKAARKAQLKAWKQAQRRRAQAEFPLPDARLRIFFDGVERLRARLGCFHDTRHAQQCIDAMALTDDEANALLDWCQAYGGHCDCEIAANTHQHWLESRDRADAAESGA